MLLTVSIAPLHAQNPGNPPTQNAPQQTAPQQTAPPTGDANQQPANDASAAPETPSTAAPQVAPEFQEFAHPFGPWCVLPPLLAIVLAIATRRIVPSLMLGILCGAVILAWSKLPADLSGAERYWELTKGSIASFGEDFLFAPLLSSDTMNVFVFTMFMGAMVAVAHASGGMFGLVDAMSPLAKTRRGGQLTGWGLGLVVFFDDYANTLLLGNTLRPVMDRLKISREKLAYLVDSTSAPVASIALVSTWVAVEVGFIKGGYEQLGFTNAEDLGFQAFVSSIPYRFYAIMALVFVFLIAWLGRDFGPMLTAERRALRRKGGGTEDQNITSSGDPFQEEEQEAAAINADEAAINPSPETPRRWINAVLPIAITLVVTIWLILVTGYNPDEPDEGWVKQFQHGNSYIGLKYGALAGFLVAALSAWAQRLLTWSRIGQAGFMGIKMVLPALMILWMASGIKLVTDQSTFETNPARSSFTIQNGVITPYPTGDNVPEDPPKIDVSISQTYEGLATLTITRTGSADQPVVTTYEKLQSLDKVAPEDRELFRAAYDRASMQRSGGLATANYVGSEIRQLVSPEWMPTIIFILASAVAFSTGTSWGTMGILTPLVVSVTYQMLALANPQTAAVDLVHHPILVGSIGSVLAGAIFGDHCSPISDTTVLSSVSSGCNHIAHVRTQMPYALVVALLVIPLGTIPVGFLGLAWWGALGCMALCGVAAYGLIFYFGKDPAAADDALSADQKIDEKA